MSEFKSEQIKAVIKDLLKKKKLTYEDVATELECSVPTVKRILGPEELSLPRLLQLCELLEINLTDLETLMQISKAPEEKFTKEQEEFLAKNSNFLAYLVLLYSMTPEEIAEKHKLNQRSTDKYLIGLEKAELIRVTGKFKVKPTYKKMPGFGAGPLGKAHFKKLIEDSGRFFVQHISNQLMNYNPNDKERIPQGYNVAAIKVSRNSYAEFIREQVKGTDTFVRLAAYEEKSMADEDLMTAVIVEGFAIMDHKDKTLDILENAFGEVRNI